MGSDFAAPLLYVISGYLIKAAIPMISDSYKKQVN
jgi:hypothetical protein